MCALRLRCIVDSKFSRWRRRSRNFAGYMLYFSIDTVLSLDRFSRFHKLIFVTPLLEFEMFVNVPVKCICEVLLNCMAWDADEYLRKFTWLSECNIPSSNACICHMSTTTLGITEMMEQTENKRNWCWMKLSHSFSWVETHLRDNTYGHNTGWSVRIKCIF